MVSTAEDEDKEDDAGINLRLVVLDTESETPSTSIVVDDMPWERRPKQGGLLGTGAITGWSRKGGVTLPAGMLVPGAVAITKLPTKKGSLGLDFISSVHLKRWAGFAGPAGSCLIPCPPGTNLRGAPVSQGVSAGQGNACQPYLCPLQACDHGRHVKVASYQSSMQQVA